MAFMLLAGHMSFTIGTHFCGGETVESKVLFNETHLGCDMMEMEKACEIPENHNNKTGIDKAPCCENEYHTFLSTNEFVNDAAPSVNYPDFAMAFVYTTSTLDLNTKASPRFYAAYRSPPVEKDIQVLFQSFLC
ncbi:MAG: hypothetical protein R6V52_08300 [Bacteroidales bacterium]